MPKRTLVRWLKFNAVGGVGIAVQLLALWLFTRALGLNYLPATALAVEAAVIHNFFWHETYTWRDRRSRPHLRKRFLKFNLTTGALSIFGNLVLMRLLAGAAHLPYLPANAIAITVCSFANFLVSDRMVFIGAAENS